MGMVTTSSIFPFSSSKLRQLTANRRQHPRVWVESLS
jgi:hypothetical protein